VEYVTRVLRLRIKDKHARQLRALAEEVNLVWNFTQELALKVLDRERRFITAYDVQPYVRGAGKAGLRLHSHTVQAVYEEYVRRRYHGKKVRLRWRVSKGARRSLGWVPYKTKGVRYRAGQLYLAGVDGPVEIWDSYGLANYDIHGGNVSEDARGRWYANLCVRVPRVPTRVSNGREAIGIDLGLNDLAVLSNGERIENQRFYQSIEPQLAVAQRARKKARVRALHAKAANRRRDYMHKVTSNLVQRYGAIYVGDVEPVKIVKTQLAKAVCDAGWGMFRTMLQYKSDFAGTTFDVVDERYTTRDCSACGSRSGPTGIAGLGIRVWQCIECGEMHSRDVNAAANILARGHARLAGGSPVMGRMSTWLV
jgi:IS605 OrfB family transposase